MVTFVSLFLWLMVDVHPVKVAVDPSVSSVEIFLDGRSVGVATAPEWEVECDFGEVLRPHELVAVARDEAGVEIGRAIQLVNLPRPAAEVEIVFEGGSAEAPEMLRLITESVERLDPLALYVTFDGMLLPSESDGRFRLPKYDPRQVHLVSAEAYFPEGITARRDITFGGAYGGRIISELTAVPVMVDSKRRITAGELQGLFSAHGEELMVAATERMGARIYMVRDHAAWPKLRNAGRVIDRRSLEVRGTTEGDLGRVLEEARVGEEIPPQKDRFYLVVPNPTPSRGLALFPVLQPFNIKRWGMPWLTTHVGSSKASLPSQRLAEAVALAGLRAAADGCPRAVVLVIGDDPTDRSFYQPEAVRKYLRTLRVPLVVWSTEKDGLQSPWGTAELTNGLVSLEKASRRLLKELNRQWIVWVEGRHLPNDVELVENELGIRLVE